LLDKAGINFVFVKVLDIGFTFGIFSDLAEHLNLDFVTLTQSSCGNSLVGSFSTKSFENIVAGSDSFTELRHTL
jgi:hypothetical protein